MDIFCIYTRDLYHKDAWRLYKVYRYSYAGAIRMAPFLAGFIVTGGAEYGYACNATYDTEEESRHAQIMELQDDLNKGLGEFAHCIMNKFVGIKIEVRHVE